MYPLVIPPLEATPRIWYCEHMFLGLSGWSIYRTEPNSNLYIHYKILAASVVCSSCSAQDKPHMYCQSALDKGYADGWQNDRVEGHKQCLLIKTWKSKLIAKEQSTKTQESTKNWYPVSKDKTEVARRQSESPEPHVRIPSLGFCQQEETPENLALMDSWSQEFHGTGRKKICTIEVGKQDPVSTRTHGKKSVTS